jgi:hypothetical protein
LLLAAASASWDVAPLEQQAIVAHCNRRSEGDGHAGESAETLCARKAFAAEIGPRREAIKSNSLRLKLSP